MLNLLVVIASTRPGRVGETVGQWAAGVARDHGAFQVAVADLAEIDLPLLDEAAHPRMRQYAHEHTKAWSRLVSAADAFVLVTPEYNYFAAPALINALDYLYHEWQYKVAGFVSYGGASGGLRSVQAIKPLLTTLGVMPIAAAVSIPFVATHLDDAKRFVPAEQHQQAASAMLDELRKWAEALVPLRAPSAR